MGGFHPGFSLGRKGQAPFRGEAVGEGFVDDSLIPEERGSEGKRGLSWIRE